VFQGATVYPSVLVLEKDANPRRRAKHSVIVCKVRTLAFQDLDEYVSEHHFEVSQATLTNGDWQLAPAHERNLLTRIAEVGRPLGEYCRRDPLFGVKTGCNEVFVVRKEDVDAITRGHRRERDIFLPYLRGRNVHRYWYEGSGEYLLFTDGLNEARYPRVMKYLKSHKARLQARTDICRTSKKWYELRPCKYYDLIRKPKIVYASVARRGDFVLDESGTFVDKTCYFIPTEDKYLLGLLNSRLLFYYFSRIAVQRRGGYFEYLTEYVSQLPIRPIDLSIAREQASHRRMVDLVTRALDLHMRAAAAKTSGASDRIQRQIDATDKQIDQLVYELYGLTDEEIRIVEGEQSG